MEEQQERRFVRRKLLCEECGKPAEEEVWDLEKGDKLIVCEYCAVEVERKAAAKERER